MGSGTSSKKRRFTPIHTDRVLLPIIAKGLLSQRELRVCAWIWSDSWGFSRQRTRPGVTSGIVSHYIGLPDSHCRAAMRSLIDRGAIKRHDDGSFEFNEHTNLWRTKTVRAERTESVRQTRTESVRAHTDQIGPDQNSPGGPKRSGVRTKSVRKTDRIGPPSYISAQQSTTKEQPEEQVGPAQKTRGPTGPEMAFLHGFKKRYGHDPEIDKGQAVKLNKLVAKHGPELVIAKINAWWDSPAGSWVKDARTIGAFLHSFDRIIAAAGMEISGDTERDRILESLGS